MRVPLVDSDDVRQPVKQSIEELRATLRLFRKEGLPTDDIQSQVSPCSKCRLSLA